MKRLINTFVIIAFIFLLSFCMTFKLITAIVERSNIASFNELSLHDKGAIKNVLNIWWKVANKFGERVEAENPKTLADVKRKLESLRNSSGYEDCMLVSENNRVISARSLINESRVAVLCYDSAEQFVYRYTEKNTYLILGRKIKPFMVSGVMFTHCVIVLQATTLNNMLRIGSYDGRGFSTVIDKSGFYIINDFFSVDNQFRNFFSDYELNRKPSEISSVMLQRKIEEFDEYTFIATRDGKKNLVTISNLDGTKWKFVSFVPLEVFSYERNQIIWIHIVSGFLCFSVLCTFMIMYIRKNEIVRRKEQKHKEELLDALSLAEQASNAKSLFLNNMSYNIRTPMNAILGFTALAKTHIASGENVVGYLDKISKSAHQLLSLINNVLDMSRIESGKMNLDEEVQNLSEIIHDLKETVQSEVNAKQQNLCIDVLNVVHEDIICDRYRLNQVFHNLISNAIKFTKPRGTISMIISEKGFNQQGYATFEFKLKDNGIGMSEEFQKSVFLPFAREVNPLAVNSQGSGLGMAITKSIVNMMGGDIKVNSSTEKGSEFIVTLEFKTEGEVQNQVTELAGKSALVIDDDMELCNYICDMVRNAGFEKASICASGEDAIIFTQNALQGAEALPIYIIDWKINDFAWIETVRKIKRIAGSDAIIIILTAFDWSNIEEEARESGVSLFISKPLFPSDLKKSLANLFVSPKPSKSAIINVLHGKRALIAEDNEASREISKIILNEAGIDADCVSDGKKAIELLKANGEGYYDFILMDIMMPILDGLEATKQIRALEDKKLANIPIIAMTAKSSEEDKKEVLNAGMNAHVAKPVDVAHLFEVVKKVLG